MKRNIKIKDEGRLKPIIGVRKKIIDQVVKHNKKGSFDYWLYLILI